MRRLLPVLLPGLLVLASLSVMPSASAAAPTVTADPLATWQTNGSVWALATSSGRVFAGGTFSSVRPPGTAVGDPGQVAAANFAAFDAASGDLVTTCDPQFTSSTGAVVSLETLELSPDGSTLYVGGRFNRVDGVAVQNFAILDSSTCTLKAGAAKPKFSSVVWSVKPTADTVYVGGAFTKVNGQTRTRLAAVSATGTLLPWAPTADQSVFAMEVAPDGSRVYAGGNFFAVNGQALHALVALDPVTGAVVQTYPDWVPYDNAQVKGLATDGQHLYVAAEGFGPITFEGRIAGDLYSDTILWKDLCRGATQEIEPYNGVLYSASHAHNCTKSLGGFQDNAMQGRQHLLANDIADGGRILPWFPDTNEAIDGKGLGPWTLVMAGEQLWVGGEFTTVNGQPQQGLTRFAPSPDVGAPLLLTKPTVTSTVAGQVRVRWSAAWDQDDGLLTYRLYRNGQVIDTRQVDSRYWRRPTLVYEDIGLTPGTVHSYRVDVSDGQNTTPMSASASVRVASQDAAYASQVLTDGAKLHWRLGESAGPTAASQTGTNVGTYVGGVTYGVSGAIAGDPNTAVTLDGATGYISSSQTLWKNPQEYSTELWFNTVTNQGGKLIGFGSAATGESTNADRHVYMNSTGQLLFGAWNYGERVVIKGSGSFNDGGWHHMVATAGPWGMHLYVDGVEVASDPAATTARQYDGYWRVGNDMDGAWPEIGANDNFQGSIDEVAVYSYQLPTSAVIAHYAAGSQ